MSESVGIGILASLLVARCSLLVALAGCGDGGGNGVAVSGDALGTTFSSSISSAQTGIAYDLDIWVPPGYAQATTSYPVIYATANTALSP